MSPVCEQAAASPPWLDTQPGPAPQGRRPLRVGF